MVNVSNLTLISAIFWKEQPKEKRFMKLSESRKRCYNVGFSFSFMDEEKWYALSNSSSNALYKAISLVSLSGTGILHLLILKITTFEGQFHYLWTKM